MSFRHLYYYQKFPDTSNCFIYVHNDFQTVILIIFFFSHGNNTAFTYILYSALESTRNNNFFTHKVFKIASLFPYPDCITQTPEIACLHTNNYILLHIWHIFPIFLTDKLHPVIFYSMIIGNTSSFYPSVISDRYCHLDKKLQPL